MSPQRVQPGRISNLRVRGTPGFMFPPERQRSMRCGWVRVVTRIRETRRPAGGGVEKIGVKCSINQKAVLE